jgi:fatty acid desaturase
MGLARAQVVESGATPEVVAHALVSDLHAANPAIFWSDMLASAAIGWTAFAVAVAQPQWSSWTVAAIFVAAVALYRGMCFTHEIAHLPGRTLRGFETTWNVLFGVPLMLPSFTYVGVHQSHHSLSTYGTKDDPEYLPFARSRMLIVMFAVQASLVLPVAMFVRFVVLSPLGLVWPGLHQWLETYASSFSMNPSYRRVVPAAGAARMRRWELAMLGFWGAALAAVYAGVVPKRALIVWLVVTIVVSFVNALRVLGAHEYDSDGTPLDRQGQLRDSIDTPGAPWTELWAPVGLRYHALHHYFPGIPYHNLSAAYRRVVRHVPAESPYRDSISTSLWRSLNRLFEKATARARS